MLPSPRLASPKFPSPLNKSFETVSSRCSGNNNDSDGDDASSVSSLEEPYTQDHGNLSPPVSYGRKTERIKPGDTILYYDPIFTAGDKRGRRETIVLEVRGKDKVAKLVLANSAMLGNTQPICRVKVRMDNNKKSARRRGTLQKLTHCCRDLPGLPRPSQTVHKGRVIPHPGVFRHVEEYVLRSAKITPELEKVRMEDIVVSTAHA